MIKGIASFPRMEIFGVPHPQDFAEKIYTNQFPAPTVLTFKYNYHEAKNGSRRSSKTTAAGENPEGISAVEQEDMEYADSLNSWVCFLCHFSFSFHIIVVDFEFFSGTRSKKNSIIYREGVMRRLVLNTIYQNASNFKVIFG